MMHHIHAVRISPWGLSITEARYYGYRFGLHIGRLYQDAFAGSLDAAKGLHDALLPGWSWVVSAKYGAVMDHDGSDDLRELKHFTSHDPEPSRAWLIAILRAVKAKG